MVAIYIYDVNSIISQIATAHDERVFKENEEYEKELKEIQDRHAKGHKNIKKDYDAKMEELVKERETAIKEQEEKSKKTKDEKIEVQAKEIADLDNETKAVIQVVKAANKQEYDLTEFIPTLEMDWLNIDWNDDNRREKVEPVSKPKYGASLRGPSAPQSPSRYMAPKSARAPSGVRGYSAPQAPSQARGPTGYNAPSSPQGPTGYS